MTLLSQWTTLNIDFEAASEKASAAPAEQQFDMEEAAQGVYLARNAVETTMAETASTSLIDIAAKLQVALHHASRDLGAELDWNWGLVESAFRDLKAMAAEETAAAPSLAAAA